MVRTLLTNCEQGSLFGGSHYYAIRFITIRSGYDSVADCHYDHTAKLVEFVFRKTWNGFHHLNTTHLSIETEAHSDKHKVHE